MSWTNKECGECRFFSRAQMNLPSGTCHAVPPVPIMVGMMKNPVSGQPVPLVRAHWPDVADTTTACGAFKERADLSAIDLSRLAEMPAEGEG